MKKLIYAIVAGTLLPAMISCTVDIDDEKVPEIIRIEPAHRSILVYMVASNSLGTGHYDTADLKEMAQFARDNSEWLRNGRLIVYWQPAEKAQNAFGKDVTTCGEPQLIEIVPETGDAVVMQTYDNALSSVSEARMNRVIADFKELAPNNEYGLILWSHSNGWQVETSSPDPLVESTEEPLIAPLAFGQETNMGSYNYMNIPALTRVLENKDFSFVYFDCCYMASIEVLYEMHNVVPYVVGSTIEVIGEGMPYHLSLPHLFDSKPDYLVNAVNVVYDYVDAKTDVNRSGAYAVIDMSKVETIAEAAKTFYSFHPYAPQGFSPQKYMYQSTCYFFDFGHIVENMDLADDADDNMHEAFETARLALLSAVEEAVVYKACTPYLWPGVYNIPLDNYCGLSSYFLTTSAHSTTKGYNTTAWWNDVARYQFDD